MVTINIDFVSEKLKRKTCFDVIVPEDAMPQNVLLLLHGRGDNHEAWIQYTNVVRYNKKSLIIIPSGDISFYLNRKHGEQFQEYLIELINFVQSKFNIKTSKVHVAGNSMGGFGSLMLAKKYPDLFETIGLFSPALNLSDEYLEKYPDIMLRDNIKTAVNDEAILKKISPKIYLYCGRKDYFFEESAKFANQYHIELKTDDYGHEWDAWDTCIKKYLESI